jgi:predicted transcriptional regulator
MAENRTENEGKLTSQDLYAIEEDLQKFNITNDECSIVGKILKTLLSTGKNLSLTYVKLRYGLTPAQIATLNKTLTEMGWATCDAKSYLTLTQEGAVFIKKLHEINFG